MPTISKSTHLCNWRSIYILACLFSSITIIYAASDEPSAEQLVVAKQLFEAGQYPEAQSAFNKISASEPKNAEALFYRGWTAFRLNQIDEAIKLLEKTTVLDATKSLYFHVLGDAYSMMIQRVSIFSKLGWAKKCLAAYDRGVSLDPDNLDVRHARCQFYRHAPSIAGGGMDKAYAEAAEIQKRDPLRGVSVFGELYIADKKFSEAFKLLEETIAKHPDKKALLYQLGRLAAKSGQQLDRGEAALREYFHHTPEPKEPSLPDAHWRLGTLYEKKGDKAAARAEYETALRLRPDYKKAQDALKELK